jgi:16S rRNA processing protein RimM
MAVAMASQKTATISDDVAIGQIVKPHGVRGDVRVRSLSDVPGRFEALARVTLVPASGEPVATAVRHVRPHGDGCYIVGFDAFATPEDVGRFRGALITIPRDAAVPHRPGSFYHYELLGLSVVTEDGRRVGRIEDILDTPGNAVFVVRDEGREVLVPAAQSVVVSIDVDRGLMTVRNLPGLLGDADAL